MTATSPSSSPELFSVLWHDRGVVTDPHGSGNRDLSRSSGIDRRPLLVVPPGFLPVALPGGLTAEPSPLFDAALVCDGDSVQLRVGRQVVFSSPVPLLPVDWWDELFVRGRLELVCPAAFPASAHDAALQAESWVGDPSCAAGAVPLELSSSPLLPAREVFARTASQFRALEGRHLPFPALPQKVPPPARWSFSTLSAFGQLPPRLAAVRDHVHVDAAGRSHLERTCPDMSGDSRYVELPFAELLSSACPRCGLAGDRPLVDMPKHLPAVAPARAAARVLSQLSFRDRLVSPSWTAVLDASAAEQRLRAEMSWERDAELALLAAAVSSELHAAVLGAAELLRHRPSRGVERALLVAADASVPQRLSGQLLAVSESFATSVLDLVRSGDDPREQVAALAQASDVDPVWASSVLAPPMAWLDSESARLVGPLHLVHVSLRHGWPALAAVRLAMLRWSRTAQPSAEHAVMVLPAPAAAVLCALVDSGCADMGALWPGDSAALLGEALGSASHPTPHFVAGALDKLRRAHGLLDPAAPVGFRPFFDKELAS